MTRRVDSNPLDGSLFFSLSLRLVHVQGRQMKPSYANTAQAQALFRFSYRSRTSARWQESVRIQDVVNLENSTISRFQAGKLSRFDIFEIVYMNFDIYKFLNPPTSKVGNLQMRAVYQRVLELSNF